MKDRLFVVVVACLVGAACATNGRLPGFTVESADLLLDGGSIDLVVSDGVGRYHAKIDRSLEVVEKKGRPLLLIEGREVAFNSERAKVLEANLNGWGVSNNCPGLTNDRNLEGVLDAASSRCLIVSSFVQLLASMRSGAGLDR